jgi:hypothetical protein
MHLKLWISLENSQTQRGHQHLGFRTRCSDRTSFRKDWECMLGLEY